MSERGRVKWFNNKAGWGFIQIAGSPDVYVRHDRVKGSGFKVLHEGEEVEFDIRKSKRGPYAVNVVPIGGAEGADEQAS